jgi:hypothetical protein
MTGGFLFAMPDRLFKERQWRNLLTEIHDGQVIAVIGPELTIGPDQAGETTTLFQHMAHELVRRLDVDETSLSTGYSLVDISNAYFQIHKMSSKTCTARRGISSGICGGRCPHHSGSWLLSVT